MKNASTPRHVAREFNARICCQLSIRHLYSICLFVQEEIIIETLERGREREISVWQSRLDRARRQTRSERSVLLHSRVDGTVIRFRGQIDAESKIALRGNGTHSSMPRKRSIARQVIGVVKNGSRACKRERVMERNRRRGPLENARREERVPFATERSSPTPCSPADRAAIDI